jgi:hypothetical protein
MSSFFEFPSHGFRIGPNANPAFTSTQLQTASTEFVTYFIIPEAATITTVGWRQNGLTGTPGTLRVGLQGVSATNGQNDGTWLGGTTNYVDYTGWSTGNNALFVTHTLPSSVTTTRGQFIALVLRSQSGTWDASNRVQISRFLNGYGASGGTGRIFSPPYTSGSGTIDNGGNDEVFLVRSSSKTYGNPYQSLFSFAATNTSNPDEIGLAFTMPSTGFSTYEIIGCRFPLATTTAGGTFDVTLYNNTTVLQQITIDTDQLARTTVGPSEYYFDETTLSTLNSGTEYILGLKATSTVTASMNYIIMPTANDITAYSNQTIRYCERQTTGAWSFTNDTRLPLITLLVRSTAFTGGSGGMIVHPGMAGGMRG